jgi:zinc-binding alcohol dehydrogenase family protein
MVRLRVMKETMKAVALTRYLPISDPESLQDFELPQPSPGKRDLLVRIEAVSVNPVDVKVRAPKPGIEAEPKILGWDAAGVVERIGSDVTLFQPGDEIYYAGSITRPGTNSEYHLVDERIAGKKPASLSFAEAAALPLTTITAWETFFERLHIDRPGGDAGKLLLIIGGPGGVGSIGIQIAKLAELSVIATASRNETQQWCKDLGADHVINHRNSLKTELDKIGVGQVDYIANFANTDLYWTVMADIIAPEGAICSIVENSEPLDLNILKSKSVAFAWEFMFTKSMFNTSNMGSQGALLNEVAKLIDNKLIRTTLTEVVPKINAKNLRDVHQRIESGRTLGKIVLAGW